MIADFPLKLNALVDGFTSLTWNTVYREGGWNAAQVVNHLADSHMNAFIRMKLGLTEETPTIKPYDENLWANTADGLVLPPVSSLVLIQGLHARWAILLESMSMHDYERKVYRPDTENRVKLCFFLGVYAWHCQHHLGHLQIIRSKQSNTI